MCMQMTTIQTDSYIVIFDIFKNILVKTDSTTISILFSDCIYSLSKEGASNELSRLKHGTRNHFKVNLKKTSLSTLILQKESEFNGRYFPYTGDRNWYMVESRRPYYICIVGGSKLMDEFVKNMKLEDFDNRTNSFFLKGNGTPEVYYTILSNSKNCKYGEYKISGKNKEFVHSLRKVEVEKDKEDGGWINGGFMVLEQGVFSYIGDNDEEIFEREPLEHLAMDGELVAYKHTDFSHYPTVFGVTFHIFRFLRGVLTG